MNILKIITDIIEYIIKFFKEILCKIIDYKGCLKTREIEEPRDLRDPTYETDEITEEPGPEESESSIILETPGPEAPESSIILETPIPAPGPEAPEELEILVSEVCPRETCSHQRSIDYKIPYYIPQLNINSSCNEIKNYILANLESSHPDAFSLSNNDTSTLSDSRKKELIFVLENSSDMVFDPPFTSPSGEQITRSPGIRFKFCCPTGENCLL